MSPRVTSPRHAGIRTMNFPCLTAAWIGCILTLSEGFAPNIASSCKRSHSMVIRTSNWRRNTLLFAKQMNAKFDDDGNLYETRYVGDTANARELKNMRFEDEMEYEDYYYDDDGDDDDEEGQDITLDRGDDYDEDDEVDDPQKTGNFWSNPKVGFDPYVRQQRPKSQRTAREAWSDDRDRPKRQSVRRRRDGTVPKAKTTFRSGAPLTPEPVRDLYDRLFWYGFDPDDTISLGDKTSFGGTKGKFNGLQFISETPRPSPKRKTRDREEFQDEDWDEDDIDERYDDEDIDIKPATMRSPGRSAPLPPRRRRSSLQDVDYYHDKDDDGDGDSLGARFKGSSAEKMRSSDRKSIRKPGGNWVSNEVSSWFNQNDDDIDDDDDDEPDEYERQGRPRRNSKKSSSWSVTDILDNVFGVNREDADYRAAVYNRRLGLGTPKPRQPTDRRRGPGYAYRLEDDDENDAVPIAEYEAIVKPDIQDAVDVHAVRDEGEESPPKKRTRSWEERAAAIERVPPSGVPAWGPSGEVGVDARTKATLDALEEIREAKHKLGQREERCIIAQEDIVVLNADIELQRKRLLASNVDPRRVHARIRQMQADLDDASRAFRRAKAEAAVARERLAVLEDRHWALLSLYDADKAFQEVVETFLEFEESERINTGIRDVADTKTADMADASTQDGVSNPDENAEDTINS